MNRPQRIVLTLGALIISLMALFPPWTYIYSHPKREQIERPAGYHSIFGQHVPQAEYELARLFNMQQSDFYFGLQFFSLRIDQTRLAIQIGISLLVVGLAFVLLRTQR